MRFSAPDAAGNSRRSPGALVGWGGDTPLALRFGGIAPPPNIFLEPPVVLHSFIFIRLFNLIAYRRHVNVTEYETV